MPDQDEDRAMWREFQRLFLREWRWRRKVFFTGAGLVILGFLFQVLGTGRTLSDRAENYSSKLGGRVFIFRHGTVRVADISVGVGEPMGCADPLPLKSSPVICTLLLANFQWIDAKLQIPQPRFDI
jgi:hypothetical protein